MENAKKGFGCSFLDSGTFNTTKEKGNGSNYIDSRLIKIEAGCFINITGSTVSGDVPSEKFSGELELSSYSMSGEQTNKALQLFNCRKFHFATLSKHLLLKKTHSEGEATYVTNDMETTFEGESNLEVR